jgi:hypothetical protein
MKPAALVGIALLTTAIANAQFTLTPQIGFDLSKTTISFNHSENANNYAQAKAISPLGSKSSVKASLRGDYRFKKGHGVFASVGTSPAVVEYSFENPLTASTNYKASTGPLQWRLEAGYMFTSKKINLQKSSGKEKSSKVEARNCSPFGCGARKSSAKENQNLNLKLQPSLGFAYLPVIKDDIIKEGSSYKYNAGNWNTGIVTGLGFELGKGRNRLFSVNVSYTKGLGNLDEKTVTEYLSSKPYTTGFTSKTSSWGMTIGVPFGFAKHHNSATKSNHKSSQQKQGCRSRCESYRGRCPRLN